MNWSEVMKMKVWAREAFTTVWHHCILLCHFVHKVVTRWTFLLEMDNILYNVHISSKPICTLQRLSIANCLRCDTKFFFWTSTKSGQLSSPEKICQYFVKCPMLTRTYQIGNSERPCQENYSLSIGSKWLCSTASHLFTDKQTTPNLHIWHLKMQLPST